MDKQSLSPQSATDYPITRLLDYSIRNQNADFHANRIGARRGDAEAETRAVGDTGWQRKPHRVMNQQRPGPAAVAARLGPGFATAATVPAQAAHWDVDRNREPVPRLAGRHQHLGPLHIVVWTRAEKGVAHAFDRGLDAREVDGNLVGEAVVGHRASVNDR